MSSFASSMMFEGLFGEMPDGMHVVLFRLGPARAVSFTDVALAAKNAAGQSDVWVHVGLTRTSFQGGDRPTALEIDGICGMWADIDIADPVHKKPGLPPSEEAARRIITAMRLPPGLVLNSGHGLQVWWPFVEVWTFDSDDERRRARILARAWAITLKERARQLGYTIDMVSDISRVMRVAGTVNAKARPVEVKILDQSDARISEDDALSVLLDGSWEQAERDIDQKRSGNDQISYGDLTLDPQADPPWEKLDILREIEPRADQAWRRKRTKRTETWSPSEWDQSLASYAAQAGWIRQEIANLLIAARRKHGEELKLRQDYFRMTIDKAMAGQEEQDAIREAVAISTDMAKGTTDERPESERSDVLGVVSKSIRCEITRVTRSRSEPPVFGIETPHGRGSLGGVEAIVSNRKFRLKVAEIANLIPRKLKDEEWEPIAQALLQVAELEDLGVETTVAGRAETLVSLYLSHKKPLGLSEMSEAASSLLPIRLDPYVGDDGLVRLFTSGLRSWIAEHQHDPMTNQEIGSLLASIEAIPETQHYRVNGRRTTRSLWRLPIHTRNSDSEGNAALDAATLAK